MKPIKLKDSRYRWGAHHPHCERHAHHLIWLGGHPLCLGCLCVVLGAAAGGVLSPQLPWERCSLPLWAMLHLLMLAPTMIQPYVKVKAYKVVARVMLGASMVSYAMSGMLWIVPPAPIPQWLLHLAVPMMLVVGYKLLSHQRIKRLDDPCSSCPLGVYPTCSWNLPSLLSEDPVLGLLSLEQIESIEHLEL